MRLIDADALFEKLFHAWGTEIDADTANEFMVMLNDAPYYHPTAQRPADPGGAAGDGRGGEK